MCDVNVQKVAQDYRLPTDLYETASELMMLHLGTLLERQPEYLAVDNLKYNDMSNLAITHLHPLWPFQYVVIENQEINILEISIRADSIKIIISPLCQQASMSKKISHS